MSLDILLQYLCYTFRTLSRDRGFTLVAILTLALDIGANIAVFSVINTLLLRPLPFPNSQQLVRIHQKDPKGGDSSMTLTNAVGNETDCNGLGSVELDGRPRSVPAFDRSIISGIAAILSAGCGVFDPHQDTTTNAATIRRQQPTAADCPLSVPLRGCFINRFGLKVDTSV